MKWRKPGLLAIDIQEGFHDPYWGPRNNPTAEQKMAEIFDLWRAKGASVFNVQHVSKHEDSPLNPRRPGVRFMSFAEPQPYEALIQKSVHSSFIGTELESELRSKGVTDLLLMGFTSDHCVSTTARMAANLGFKTSIAAEATATFDRFTFEGVKIRAQVVHEASLASLHREFATVLSQADALKFLEDV